MYQDVDLAITKILVRADHFWSTKIGPGGPNLVAKIGPARPKMVRCRISIEFIATKPVPQVV